MLKNRQPIASARNLPPDTRAGKGFFARSVGAFVPKVVAPAFEKFGFHSAEIMTSWDTIVGADLARQTRPETIKWPRGAKSRAGLDDEAARSAGATLTIGCDPAFALEVSYRKQEITDRINRYFGYRAIAQLRVIQAPRADESVDLRNKAPAKAKVFVRPDPTAGSANGLEAALDALGKNITAAAAPR